MVLSSPITVSASALLTDYSMSASAKCSVERIEIYWADSIGRHNISIEVFHGAIIGLGLHWGEGAISPSVGRGLRLRCSPIKIRHPGAYD